MKLIGVTGNIASGKSTISKIIAEHYNLPLISVDEFSRNYITTYSLLIEGILEDFGYRNKKVTLQEDLKAHFFTDRKFKHLIEKAVSNAFWRYMNYTELDRHDTILVEHPIMFEMGDEKEFCFIIGVEADENIRIDRMYKRGYSHATAIQRINNQTPLYENKDRIDLILDNNIPLTKEQIINELQNSREFKALVSQGALS